MVGDVGKMAKSISVDRCLVQIVLGALACCLVLTNSAISQQSLPSSKEQDVPGPDGLKYSVSRTFAPDAVGPMIILAINKPVRATELSASQIRSFIDKLLSKECGLVGGKPTSKHVFEPKVNTNRYVWKGQKRVSWGYTSHCIR